MSSSLTYSIRITLTTRLPCCIPLSSAPNNSPFLACTIHTSSRLQLYIPAYVHLIESPTRREVETSKWHSPSLITYQCSTAANIHGNFEGLPRLALPCFSYPPCWFCPWPSVGRFVPSVLRLFMPQGEGDREVHCCTGCRQGNKDGRILGQTAFP